MTRNPTRQEVAMKCPRCGSPRPTSHPAVQFEGEVQICPDPFHASTADGRAMLAQAAGRVTRNPETTEAARMREVLQRIADLPRAAEFFGSPEDQSGAGRSFDAGFDACRIFIQTNWVRPVLAASPAVTAAEDETQAAWRFLSTMDEHPPHLFDPALIAAARHLATVTAWPGRLAAPVVAAVPAAEDETPC